MLLQDSYHSPLRTSHSPAAASPHRTGGSSSALKRQHSAFASYVQSGSGNSVRAATPLCYCEHTCAYVPACVPAPCGQARGKGRAAKTTFSNAKAVALAARVDAPDLVSRMSRRGKRPHVTPYRAAPQYGETLSPAELSRLDVTQPATHPAERAKSKRELKEATLANRRVFSGHLAPAAVNPDGMHSSPLASSGMLRTGSSFRLGRSGPAGAAHPGYSDERFDFDPAPDVKRVTSMDGGGFALVGGSGGVGTGGLAALARPGWGDAASSSDLSSGGSSLGVTTDVIDLLRKGWSASHHRPVTAPADPHAPEDSSLKPDSEIAEILADWVDGMDDSSRHHNTVALFLEKKLGKVEAKILQARDPNRMRTACAVGLLDDLIQRSRQYAPALVAVRFDLLKSIYQGRAIEVREFRDAHLEDRVLWFELAFVWSVAGGCSQHTNVDWKSYHMHRKKQTTKETMQALLGMPTYYDLLEECEMKLVSASHSSPATCAATHDITRVDCVQEHEQLWRRKDAETAYKVGIRDATVEARFLEKQRNNLRLVRYCNFSVYGGRAALTVCRRCPCWRSTLSRGLNTRLSRRWSSTCSQSSRRRCSSWP